MAKDFILEIRDEGSWFPITSIPEKWFDKNDSSFLINRVTQEELLDFENKKLRLYRIHHDLIEVFGHETAEFDVWRIVNNKVYAINPDKNFRHKMVRG